ncbi:type VI secretion system protein TssL, short form [Pantoea sp. SO10]|uniref:type VI secretion system protein TssL, short form n=1 Tax=Pantoea sp. SO10 TaxID=2575375 RepID=UPI0010C9686E|nr:type VI secretion system protein TssL, short form [Pantoea sp. SO10]QCP58816.1 DotU family type IV/VI secretion system protein [Pantoea sp. SO10]
MHEAGTSSSGRRALPPTVRDTDATDPVNLIDRLLQDTFLFVMHVLHNSSLQRDNDFYRRGCKLVETLKEKLEALQASDEFTHHVLYAQCGLLDQIVLNSASQQDNHAWLPAPLQSRYLSEMRAGEVIPERLKMLLRQPAPDMRLLVLYQRIFAMGFGRYSPDFQHERRELMESLDALVPSADTPQSAPLVVELRPRTRDGLLRSGRFHIALIVVVIAALWFGLSFSLSHFLNNNF